MEALTCLASTIIDAFAVITPLCVFRRHGLAHEAGHEHIHNRDVGFLVSNDVESPAGLQVADVVEDQRQLWKVLLQPGLLSVIAFATERVLEVPAAGAAEVLQNLNHRIRATACRPNPP